MSTFQTLLTSYKADSALRAGDFILMPTNAKAPIITSHPIRNIIQTTHMLPLGMGEVERDEIQYAPLIPTFNTYNILENTEIHWTMFVTDPGNINDPTSDENVTYVWKKNGTPIYQFNSQNNNKGTRSVTYLQNQVTSDINGEYVCEVSNEYGTTTTVPFTLNIIELDQETMLYTNLINNGDGEGGLDGWVDLDASFNTKTINQRSGNLSNPTIADFIIIKDENRKTYPFTFNTTGPEGLFFPLFYKFAKKHSNAFTDLTAIVPENNDGSPKGLESWEWWMQVGQVPSLIANEGMSGEYGPQGFYPAPGWIDKYNKNNNKSNQALSDYKTLQEELSAEEGAITYFTRNPIKFSDRKDVTLSQTVDVAAAGIMIDGTIPGIGSLSGHFFAYVGIGISRYSISFTKNKEVRTVNWYVKDYESYKNFLKGVSDGQSLAKIKPDKGTPIIITPHTDDMVAIKIQPQDAIGQAIGAPIDVPTPTAQDIWAAKEKVWFPLQLYPIISFFNPNKNPIQVFDTTYTTTEALQPLMGGTSDIEANMANIKPLEDQITGLNYLINTQQIHVDYITKWQERVKSYQDRKAEMDADPDNFNRRDRRDLEDKENDANVAMAWLSGTLGGEYDGRIFVSVSNKATSGTLEDNLTIFKEEIAEWSLEKSNLQQTIAFRKNNPNMFGGKSAMSEELIETVTPFKEGLDRSAAFILRRYGKGFLKNNKLIPTDYWEPGGFNEAVEDLPPTQWYANVIQTGAKHRALFDQGASAFFGVQASVPLPFGTKFLKIDIETTNNHPAREDDYAAQKGWEKEEIYNTLFNLNSNDSIIPNENSNSTFPLHEYNNPRCAITKIKLQLIPNTPNSLDITDKHITYNLPPYNMTVIGLAKGMIQSDLMDTSKPGPFLYNLIQPQLESYAPTTSTSEKEKESVSNQFFNLINGPAGFIINQGPTSQRDSEGNPVDNQTGTTIANTPTLPSTKSDEYNSIDNPEDTDSDSGKFDNQY